MTTVMRRLLAASLPLTGVGLLMLTLMPVSLAAMVLDPREILGAPAWLKPAKFAFSTGTFCLTLAWILSYLPASGRLRGIVGWTTAGVFVVEVGIIDVQAWRGTTSHFNVATPLDGILFSIMGVLILLQTLMTVAVAVALWRTRLSDPAFGWALRLGVTLSIAGAATGGLMTTPTADQLAAARAGGLMTVAGAHSVGGPDGGPGLPGTGWSTDHGDLRVPHFIGLHAVQVIPLIAAVIARRRLDPARQARAVIGAAASYAALFALLLWQALRGQSVVAPDAATVGALGVWLAATMGAVALLGRASPGRARTEGMAG